MEEILQGEEQRREKEGGSGGGWIEENWAERERRREEGELGREKKLHGIGWRRRAEGGAPVEGEEALGGGRRPEKEA